MGLGVDAPAARSVVTVAVALDQQARSSGVAFARVRGATAAPACRWMDRWI